MHGTFTCAMIQFNKKYATILVIGDCQLLIVRNNELYYKSKINRDLNEIPSQIGILNENIIDIYDNEIVLYNIVVKKDDKIIMYTDGVLDNISLEDILNSNTCKEICYKSFISGKKRDDITCVIINIT
jgi:serine/threonine protein phosphatase PrpC